MTRRLLCSAWKTVKSKSNNSSAIVCTQFIGEFFTSRPNASLEIIRRSSLTIRKANCLPVKRRKMNMPASRSYSFMLAHFKSKPACFCFQKQAGFLSFYFSYFSYFRCFFYPCYCLLYCRALAFILLSLIVPYFPLLPASADN